MPWGRVDDQHYRHEKVHDLADEHRKGCLALYWLAISWCNDRLTDGRVPAGTVRVLGGDLEEADELVRVGLWEKDGRGFRVHDFLDFNKSKAQVEAERAQRIEAGKLGAQARWHGGSPSGSSDASPSVSPSEPTGEPDGGSDAPVSRTPSPSPRVHNPVAEPVSESSPPNPPQAGGRPSRAEGTNPRRIADDAREAERQERRREYRDIQQSYFRGELLEEEMARAVDDLGKNDDDLTRFNWRAAAEHRKKVSA